MCEYVCVFMHTEAIVDLQVSSLVVFPLFLRQYLPFNLEFTDSASSRNLLISASVSPTLQSGTHAGEHSFYTDAGHLNSGSRVYMATALPPGPPPPALMILF